MHRRSLVHYFVLKYAVFAISAASNLSNRFVLVFRRLAYLRRRLLKAPVTGLFFVVAIAFGR
jgi:hypothetical protein